MSKMMLRVRSWACGGAVIRNPAKQSVISGAGHSGEWQARPNRRPGGTDRGLRVQRFLAGQALRDEAAEFLFTIRDGKLVYEKGPAAAVTPNHHLDLSEERADRRPQGTMDIGIIGNRIARIRPGLNASSRE